MSNLALMEVQRGLYAQLIADSMLTDMVSGVYDVAPQDKPLPYVVIGDGKTSVTAADSLDLSECRLMLHIWTEAPGRKTALSIMNRLYAILHLGVLALDGFDPVTLRVEQAATAIDEHGNYIHATMAILATVVEAV